MKNIIACHTNSYGKHRDRALESAPEAGLRYVDVPVPAIEDVDRVKAEVEKHGLELASVSAGCDVSKEGGLEEFVPKLEAASKLGVKVIFSSVRADENIDRHITYGRLREAGDMAAQHGVTIAMETHPILAHNADEALKTVQGVNHDSIRINFDTGNIYFYNEGRNAVDEVRKIAEYVASVHLKDTDGRPKSWYFPTLGEGVVDFAGVFKILNDVGFYGPFTMELEGIKGEDLDYEQTQERVAKSVEYLKSIGCM